MSTMDKSKVRAALPPLIGVADAAAIFNRSPQTIRRWIRAGNLRAIRMGGAVFVDAAHLNALILDGLTQAISPMHCNKQTEVISKNKENESTVQPTELSAVSQDFVSTVGTSSAANKIMYSTECSLLNGVEP